MSWLSKISYTPEEEAELKKWVKGTCYKDAGMFAALNQLDLVHAIVTTPTVVTKTEDGKYVPKPFGHAWCEKDGKVYDVTKGLGVSLDGKTPDPSTAWPVKKYYDLFHPKIVARYKSNDILPRTLKKNHWGPWD